MHGFLASPEPLLMNMLLTLVCFFQVLSLKSLIESWLSYSENLHNILFKQKNPPFKHRDIFLSFFFLLLHKSNTISLFNFFSNVKEIHKNIPLVRILLVKTESRNTIRKFHLPISLKVTSVNYSV